MSSLAPCRPPKAVSILSLVRLAVSFGLLWFCIVLAAPQLLVRASRSGSTLPWIVTEGLRGVGSLLHSWWLVAAALVAVGVWFLWRAPADGRPRRAAMLLESVAMATLLIAAATAALTILGLIVSGQAR